MRSLILAILMFWTSGVQATDPADHELRDKLFALNTDSRKAQSLLDELQEIPYPTALIIAYRGACKAHIAKISRNPLQKYTLIRKANRDLALAVQLDKYNVEIRFLRYAIQLQTPGILGLSTHMKEDRQIIMHHFESYNWSQIDSDIVRYICDFMVLNGQCTEDEKGQLHQFLSGKI